MKSGNPSSAAALAVLVRLLRPLHRRLTAALEAELAEAGVSMALRGVMERLYEGGAQTVPALARGLLLPRQFALKLVGQGERLGLMRRTANAAHRRSDLVMLTEAGRGAIVAVLEREAALLDAVADRFDADDVEAAIRVLGTFADALPAAGRR